MGAVARAAPSEAWPAASFCDRFARIVTTM
jgi:hypothetical protein